MKRLPALLLLLSVTVYAQQPVIEYGSPSELKGVTKVFIDTGTDLKSREQILKELRKSDLKLDYLDSPEGAEIVLMFSATSESYLSGATHRPPANEGGVTTSTPVYRNIYRGSGLVLIPKSNNRVRVLMDFSGSRRFRWTKNPSTQFAKAFIKAFKEANK